jgi:hypothetical protein
MTKLLRNSLLAAVFIAPAALAGGLPQEGDFKATGVWVDGPFMSLATGDKQSVFIGEGTEAFTNDAGQGFFNNLNARCLEAPGFIDSRGSHASGFCTAADAGGDKIFYTWEVAKQAGESEGKGVKTFTGGTGKYVGLSGKADFTTTRLAVPDKEAQHASVIHVSGHYRLGSAATQ